MAHKDADQVVVLAVRICMKQEMFTHCLCSASPAEFEFLSSEREDHK